MAEWSSVTAGTDALKYVLTNKLPCVMMDYMPNAMLPSELYASPQEITEYIFIDAEPL